MPNLHRNHDLHLPVPVRNSSQRRNKIRDYVWIVRAICYEDEVPGRGRDVRWERKGPIEDLVGDLGAVGGALFKNGGREVVS